MLIVCHPLLIENFTRKIVWSLEEEIEKSLFLYKKWGMGRFWSYVRLKVVSLLVGVGVGLAIAGVPWVLPVICGIECIAVALECAEGHRNPKKPLKRSFKYLKRKCSSKIEKAKQNSYTGAPLATPESDLLRKRSPASSCILEDMTINFHTSDFIGALESTLESDTPNTVNLIINNGLMQPGCYDDTEDISQRRS